MGYKTVIFTNDIEQRTYVQGEFVGKYFGDLNHQKSASNFEFYNIQIYEGEISNLKNEKEHPHIINETVYNAVVSETQLTQKSFENVVVNFDQIIQKHDSFRLAIKEPKLESVQIYDVIKDGNQTFGTLTCLVSGYLSKVSIETCNIEVETCDKCDQFLEECTCKTSKTSSINVIDEPVSTSYSEESFWYKNFGFLNKNRDNWGWNIFDNSSFGCLGLLGLFLGILVLLSFGLPGILLGSLIFLIYMLSGQLTRSFPNLKRSLRWFFYALIGLLFIGCLFHILNDDKNAYSTSTPKQKTIVTQNRKSKEIKNSSNSTSSNSKLQNGETNSSLEQPPTLVTDVIDNTSQEPTELINKKTNNYFELNSNTPSEEMNSSPQQTGAFQTAEIKILLESESESEFQNNESSKTSENINETQIPKLRQKQNRITEIMSGIEFHEGEVFICKGKSSTRYHFNPSCPGLSNCSTLIYQINIPVAKRLGRTLCKIEE